MISLDRWQKFTLSQQMGHVGSELSRARHWEEQKDQESCHRSLERVLELIELTVEDKKHRARLKEILRLRELICDWYGGKHFYDFTPKQLEEYCLTYALLSK